MTNSSATLILAVPGSDETQELSRAAVLAGIAKGEIGPDRWVWIPDMNDWKQVAEIPDLQPVASEPSFINTPIPAPVAHFPAAPEPSFVEPVPVAVSAHNAAPTRYSQPMEIKHEFPIFKVMFFVLFLAVAGILGANYFMVDQPFATNLAATSFAPVPAYAHLGAFAEPGALVIHVPPTVAVNADNFADFLVALAKSTPPQPFNGKPFDGVGITSSWQSQYVMNGIDWQTLGNMDHATADEKMKFAVEHLEQIDGTPLVNIRKREDPAIVLENEKKAWLALVSNFQARS
jgi:hypothetical protein